jgi:quercetin dioxygenase-like cupin family protein
MLNQARIVSGSTRREQQSTQRQGRIMKQVLQMGLVVTLGLMASVAFAADPPAAKAVPLMTKPLIGIDGQEATMLTVELPPGADSPPHRHNASTFVYVLEGTVVMQVKGGSEQTLSVGQTFYESPSDIHSVSRNASKTAPAKILVVMVKPVGAPISVPVK